MPRFFPRETIHWRALPLHPLRAFALNTIELAGITGVALRLYRALVLGNASWPVFIAGLVGGALFLCGMLTWHLGNFPLRRWFLRATLFVIIESAAEFGTSSVLIALNREPLGSRMATWADWWPLAGQTIVERALIVLVYSLVLAASVQIVRRTLDRRRIHDTSHVTIDDKTKMAKPNK